MSRDSRFGIHITARTSLTTSARTSDLRQPSGVLLYICPETPASRESATKTTTRRNPAGDIQIRTSHTYTREASPRRADARLASAHARNYRGRRQIEAVNAATVTNHVSRE